MKTLILSVVVVSMTLISCGSNTSTETITNDTLTNVVVGDSLPVDTLAPVVKDTLKK